MMERLTIRLGDGTAIMKSRGLFNSLGVELLAAYEDTGVTPGEVTAAKMALMGKSVAEIKEFDGLTINRLRELAKADKGGRLVVLPCKVGDTVFVTGTTRTVQATIDEAYLDDAQGVEYLVSFECTEDCDGCPFNDWKQDYSGEYSCDGEWGQASIRGADIGKTVFLTREGAEAALKEAAHDEP